jgi:hypothetical protein
MALAVLVVFALNLADEMIRDALVVWLLKRRARQQQDILSRDSSVN